MHVAGVTYRPTVCCIAAAIAAIDRLYDRFISVATTIASCIQYIVTCMKITDQTLNGSRNTAVIWAT